MSGGATSFYIGLSNMEVIMGEHVREWMRSDMEILHIWRWIMFGGHGFLWQENSNRFTIMRSDRDHHFLKYIIGREMSGDPTSFYTRLPDLKVIIGEDVIKWMRK